jgi:creatinine amidohydrolase
MSPRPWIIAETNWKHVKATPYEVALLPWGATEAHNWHLPYATDSLQNDAIAAEAGRIAWEQGREGRPSCQTCPLACRPGSSTCPSAST